MTDRVLTWLNDFCRAGTEPIGRALDDIAEGIASSWRNWL